jgi:exonuclease SbcC
MHATEGPKLDFRVLDNYQCGERRSSKSLSGGESFVVALALALGLASTRGGRLRMETLLIDEGFGALDPATLQVATAALSSLQAALGVRIGLISHVEYLREAVPAQLLVEPVGMGRSVVRPA